MNRDPPSSLQDEGSPEPSHVQAAGTKLLQPCLAGGKSQGDGLKGVEHGLETPPSSQKTQELLGMTRVAWNPFGPSRCATLSPGRERNWHRECSLAHTCQPGTTAIPSGFFPFPSWRFNICPQFSSCTSGKAQFKMMLFGKNK